MAEPDTFIAAICSSPADDVPRLAYADWCEERGESDRANFIRKQIRLARLPQGVAETRELYQQCADLLRAHAPAWVEPICKPFEQLTNWQPKRISNVGLGLTLGYPISAIEFVRGFIEQMTFSPRSGADYAPLGAICQRQPITRLALRSPADPGPDLNGISNAFVSIQALTFQNAQSTSAIGRLFDSFSWRNVKRLALFSVENEVIASICRQPLARQLTGLKLAGDSSAFAELTRFPLDDRMQELVVLRSGEALSIPHLCGVSFRPTLKTLVLSELRLGDNGMSALARGDVWLRLRTLVLDRNRFGDPGWSDWVRGRRTPELRALSAKQNYLTDRGAMRLAESPLSQTLEWIDLRGNRIGRKGALTLARALVEGPLKLLYLQGNPLTDSDTQAVRSILGDRVDRN